MAARGLTFAILLASNGCCLTVVTGLSGEVGGHGSSSGPGSSTGPLGSTGGTTGGTTGSGTTTGRAATSSGTSTGISKVGVGACSGDDQCLSGVCGVDGTGHCCQAACASVTPPCGATDCAADTGACLFPASGTACGPPQSCTGDVQSGPDFCDGLGNCSNNTVDCAPFACGANACLTAGMCISSADCASGQFCDIADSTCCSGLAEYGSVAVDSATGNDGVCCGLGSKTPCQTLTRAVELVDSARARHATLYASVNGGGGDWGPAETYPVVLGWGVILRAPGVFFSDPAGNAEIFDVDNYSVNDTEDFASISGTDEGVVTIGVSQAGVQSPDPSSIQIEVNDRLYLANVHVSSSAQHHTAAITVTGGATLTLGQDISVDGITGPVTIGDVSGNGWDGIVCTTEGTQGCYVNDVNLLGLSSVTILGQADVDIDAEDHAVIALSSLPVIGVTPGDGGYQSCPSKPDLAAGGGAILLTGSGSVTLTDALLQCIDGTAIDLQSGTPVLNLSNVIIQHSQVGLRVVAGTAELLNSTIFFNVIGAWQGGTGNLDLTNGDECAEKLAANNVVACNSGAEVGQSGGGISVFNASDRDLFACFVSWDTPGPDVFFLQCARVELRLSGRQLHFHRRPIVGHGRGVQTGGQLHSDRRQPGVRRLSIALTRPDRVPEPPDPSLLCSTDGLDRPNAGFALTIAHFDVPNDGFELRNLDLDLPTDDFELPTHRPEDPSYRFRTSKPPF